MSTEPPKPAEPDVEARVRDSFARQGLMRHLGAQLIAVYAGRVDIRLPYRVELTQQDGYFHAGATSAIADTAGGYAGLSVFPAGSAVLTVEYKINLVNPARGECLEAIGTVIRSGRTLTVCQLEVFATMGSQRTLVAMGQQTLIRLPAPADRTTSTAP
jgi:uncharacterized protein (TIGR00369 family)